MRRGGEERRGGEVTGKRAEGRGDMRELGQNNAEKRGKRWRGLKRKREQNGDEREKQIREERG